MTVELDKDVEEFLEEQRRLGSCASPAALVNDLLRAVRDQQRTFAPSPEIEEWLLESAGQPATPLSASDFDQIRRRLRARVAAGQ